AGQGDLQLFDLSEWFNGQYATYPTLKNYFSVQGNVTSLSIAPDVLYAGTAFVFVGDKAVENPIEDASLVNHLGGGLNTIVNNQLLVLDQEPALNTLHYIDSPIAVTFNRILDNQQFEQVGQDFVTLINTATDLPVDGYLSQQVTNEGSKLYFRPTNALAEGIKYRLTISTALKDIHNQNLSDAYSFTFLTQGQSQPVLESVYPTQASWRGGQEITLSGSGFDNESVVKVGELSIDSQQFSYQDQNEIRFILPPLLNEIATNKLVGIAVVNNKLTSLLASSFNYIADPTIVKIGTYNVNNQQANYSQHQLLFNSAQYIAISGNGFGLNTAVSVNGQVIEKIDLVNDQLLSLRLPDNHIGKLQFALSNTGFSGVDTVTNNQLEVLLDAKGQLAKTTRFSRNDKQLVTAYGNEIRLYQLAEGQIPQFISKFSTPATVKSMVIEGNYVVALDNNHQVSTFDISKAFSPELISTYANASNTPFSSVTLSNNTVVLKEGNNIYYGNIFSQDLAKLALPSETNIIDIKVDDEFLYLLTQNQLEVRTIQQPEQLQQAYTHDISVPQSILLDGPRLLLKGLNKVSLLDKSLLINSEPPLIGSMPLTVNNRMAVNGELLAVSDGQSLSIFDMNLLSEQQLELNKLSNIKLPSSSRGLLSSLNFNHDLLEWVSNGTYHNVSLPFANISNVSPNKISSEYAPITLSVTGEEQNWKSVTLQSHADSAHQEQLGSTLYSAQKLSFVASGSPFELNESYSISLLGQYLNPIIGGQVNIDLPIRLTTDALFGTAKPEAKQLSPNIQRKGKPTHYQLAVENANNINGINVAGVELLPGQWTVESEQLVSFELTPSQAGLYSLTLKSEFSDNVLPAALSVVNTIAISELQVKDSAKIDQFSEMGGDTITAKIQGLSEGITAHWFADNLGIIANETNKVNFTQIDEQLSFVAPEAVAGREYKLTIIRAKTDEIVSSETVLLAVDDLSPSIVVSQPLTLSQALIFKSSEPLDSESPVSATIIKTFKDYDNKDTRQDISAQFKAPVIANNIIKLELFDGRLLEANAQYDISIDGLTDMSGNALRAGKYVSDGIINWHYLAPDLLAPDFNSVALLDANTSKAVDALTELKKGTNQRFKVAASDNYKSEQQLSYSYRLSQDNSLSYQTGWQHISNQTFDVSITEAFQSLSILLRISDGANYVEKRFDIDVIDAQIQLDSLTTLPVQVEEMGKAEFVFNFTGDTDQIRSVFVETLDSGIWLPTTYQGSLNQAKITLNQPKLSELTDVTEQGKEIPVKVKVAYGVSGKESYVEFIDSYLLQPDSTTPTLHFVSPSDGTRVAKGEVVDIILSNFDRYGVKEVKLCIDPTPASPMQDVNACELLADTNYVALPVAADQSQAINLYAQATDLNDLKSEVRHISLLPYDANNSQPVIEIVGLQDGQTFYANEQIGLQVRMEDLPSASIYLDIAGDTSALASVEITKSENKRLYDVSLTLPDVAENSVVVLRVEAPYLDAQLKSQRVLNLHKNSAIEESAQLILSTNNNLLSGTELWFEMQPDEAMLDFSKDSTISLFEPADIGQATSYASEQLHKYVADITSPTISLETHLKDRSQNEKVETKQINKQAYFNAQESIAYQTQEIEYQITDWVTVADGSLVWLEDNHLGQYRVRNAEKQLFAGEGTAKQLLATETQLIVELATNAGQQVTTYLFSDESSATTPISGQLLQGAGDVVYLQNDKLLTAQISTATQPVMLVGTALDSTIIDAHVLGQQLFVLNENGLKLVEVNADIIPTLTVTAELNIQGITGFDISNDKLWLISEGKLSTYQWTVVDDQISVQLDSEIILEAQVLQIKQQGKLTWLQLNSATHGIYWQAWDNGQAVGIISEESDKLFTESGVYSLQNGVQITLRDIEVVKQNSPSASVENGNFAWTIKLDGDFTPESIYFTNVSNELLPAQMQLGLPGCELCWSLPYQEGVSEILLQSSSFDAITIPLSFNASGAIQVTHPIDASSYASQAIVPVIVEAVSDAQISQLTLASQENSMSIIANKAIQWLQMPLDGEVDLSISQNGQAQPLNVTAGEQTTTAVVHLSGIQNNQLLEEGSQLTFSYNVAQNEEVNELAYVQVSLLNTNQQVVYSQKINSANAQLNWSLPTVSVQQGYQVVARAYFMDAYQFTESSLNVRITPKLVFDNVEVELPRELYVGSILDINLAESNAFIQVFEQSGALQAVGSSSVSYTVQANDTLLTVKVSLDDGLGNTSFVEKQIKVRVAPDLSVTASSLDFDAYLPTVGGYWYSNGNQLFSKEDHHLEFSGEITAIKTLGDKLLVAVKGDGVQLIEVTSPTSYQQHGRFPYELAVTGLAVSNNSILVNSADQAKLLTRDGDTFKVHKTLSYSAINKVIANEDNYYVLHADGIVKLSKNGQAVAQYARPEAQDLLLQGQSLYLLANHSLQKLSSSLVPVDTLDNTHGQRMAMNQGQLYIFDNLQNRVTIIDVAANKLQQLGSFLEDNIHSVDTLYWSQGQLLLAGQEDFVLSVNAAQPVELLYSNKDSVKGQVLALTHSNGNIVAAQDNYGAVVYQADAGLWNRRLVPSQPYSVRASDVVANDNYLFVTQPDAKRVRAISQTNQSERNLLSGANVSHIQANKGSLVASIGNSLKVINTNNWSQVSIDVSNETIKLLAVSGQQALVATDSNALYLVNLQNKQAEQLLADNANTIVDIAFNQNNILYTLQDDLYRIDPTNKQTELVALPGFDQFSQIELEGAMLWIASEHNNQRAISVFDSELNLLVATDLVLPQTAVTAMSAFANRLVVGLGNQGIEVYELEHQLLQSASSLLSPLPQEVTNSGFTLDYALNSETGIAATNFLVNGQVMESRAIAESKVSIALPASLLNGQAFEVSAEIERLDGQVLISKPQSLTLQLGTEVSNDFNVQVEMDENSWAPSLLEIKAVVNNSENEVQQVEFLVADNEQGPWSLIDSVYGPEYLISRYFPAQQADRFIKVKAIDVYGNSAESSVKRFNHSSEVNKPTAQVSLSGISAKSSEKLTITGYPYTLTIDASDTESGIEKVLLRRNGKAVAVKFGQQLVYSEDADLAEPVNFEVEVTDKAGNTDHIYYVLNIVEDTLPEVTDITVVSSVREQSSFNISFSASDDAGLAYYEVMWNGFPSRVDLSGEKQISKSATVRDNRSERITEDLPEMLTLTVVDISGKKHVSQHPVTVIKDNAPNTEGISWSLASNAFYDSAYQLNISGLVSADDGQGNTLKIWQVGAPSELLASYALDNNQDVLNYAGQYPPSNTPDSYQIQLELVDRLGQSTLSDIKTTHLIKAPNQIRFNSSDPLINVATAKLGESPIYQVEVLDSAGVGVSGQQVNWTLRNIATGSTQSLGESFTAEQGMTQWTLNTNLVAQAYELRAQVTDYPLLSKAVKSVQITAGASHAVEVENLAGVTANELFTVQLQAVDLMSNKVSDDQASQVTLVMPNTHFTLQPQSNVVISDSGEGIQQATVTLVNGQATLQAQATTLAGTYKIAINSPLVTRYQTAPQALAVNTSEVPVVIVAAEAARLLFLNEQGELLAQGEIGDYGQKDKAQFKLQLVDAFNNAVSVIAGEEANHAITLEVNGAGHINESPLQAVVSLQQGTAEFEVSSELAEVVELKINSVPAGLVHLDISQTHQLRFNKQAPRIINSWMAADLNSTALKLYFEYDETPVLDSQLTELILDGESLLGSAELNDKVLVFTPESNELVYECYEFDNHQLPQQGFTLYKANSEFMTFDDHPNARQNSYSDVGNYDGYNFSSNLDVIDTVN
ncbi:MAG: hypothetical protein GY951_06660, partial [Psychromonas sp.]|nr:hypothetical protein [Psychromonas sp.]